jgi:hypothetical protein
MLSRTPIVSGSMNIDFDRVVVDTPAGTSAHAGT